MTARSPLRNVNDMVLALLLLLAGVGPGGSGPGGAAGQLAAKPTRGPHPSSPCPSVFSYEGREPEKNRWYGVILVTTDEALDGLRLNVRLTHRAQILGNFIGDVSTMDNVDFTILSLKEKLSPGPPLPVRIFAAFGDRDDIPYIASIKLNGRTICGNTNSISSLENHRSQSSQSSRGPKPPLSRPAGVGGAGGGAGGAGAGLVGAGSSVPYEEEARRSTQPPPTPRPTPPPPRTTTTTPPPPRETAAPPAATRAPPAYESAPSVNPDNYYPSNSQPYNNRNPEPYEGKRPAASRPSDDRYSQQHNRTAMTDGERGVYRPPTTTERYEPPRPATERPAPVYTTKYAPSTERDVYSTSRPTQTPRASSSRPTPSQADRRPAPPADVDRSPQPWPTSNYDDPSSRGGARPRPARSTCGTVAPPATPLIINGETSIPGKWPWHVALYKPHGRDWKYQCGGSLVSPTVVVTAAHCVTTTVGRPVGPESLLVFLGKHALRTTSEDGVQDKHVYFIHVHPEYNYTNYRNDIAVLILSSPATITSAVRPVCLWDKAKVDLANVEGKFGTVVGWRTDLATSESDKVVGWGIETDGLLTEELHQALMPVVSPAICVYSYPSFFGVYTNNQTYCAGYSPDQPAAGTSVCNGDSGGGMFFKRDEEAADDEAVWMLRGLVSLSVRTKQDRCDPSHFVVFTDVAKYVDWLENFLIP